MSSWNCQPASPFASANRPVEYYFDKQGRPIRPLPAAAPHRSDASHEPKKAPPPSYTQVAQASPCQPAAIGAARHSSNSSPKAQKVATAGPATQDALRAKERGHQTTTVPAPSTRTTDTPLDSPATKVSASSGEAEVDKVGAGGTAPKRAEESTAKESGHVSVATDVVKPAALTYPDFEEGDAFHHSIWPSQETSIAFEELPRLNYAFPTPLATHRYRFACDPPADEEEEGWARCSFHRQIVRQASAKGVNVGRPAIIFPTTFNEAYVDITYGDLESWTAGRDFGLTFNDTALWLVSSCRPLGLRTTVLSVDGLPPTTDFAAFLRCFQSALGTYLAVDRIWAKYVRYSDGSCALGRKLTILATYKDKHDFLSLPGWLLYRGFEHRLSFIDRPDLCCSCRLSREPHTNVDCIWQRCRRCGERGHKRVECKDERPTFSLPEPKRTRLAIEGSGGVARAEGEGERS
ncbi:uncharacterized protein PFL1_00788 [Pseudozyma flocculosa PF-1]|uniref:uncharacterized protein n=1 Tax=Pseudozyma flocculosa PF-1 TaxID=1277687 RepID=UPI0004560401|nr:uncharacterized protein PFL1_00788 [Pseudozyma flocculosa PF-1]EPQ31453.1 hypothetical protein PFL1_00788 [Pseudozyma flocculosa PF-1]